MNQREIKGKQIAEKPDQITRINETHYRVNSQSRNKQHDVISTEFGWSCSCEDHRFRNTCCKHIHTVEISNRIRKEVRQNVVISPIDNKYCIYCQSTNTLKRGIRKNKTHSV